MNSVVHFEMPAEDKKRVSEFYAKTFGWKMEMTGPEMGEYIIATTTETDENRMVKKPGAINGGFFTKDNSKPGQHPSVVIAVENIDKAMKLVQENGGKVFGEPIEIPGIGLYVSFQDTEGNRVSLLEPPLM
jgi:uncharacterized protein